MEAQTLYELIGYVASALIAISLTMSSILKLRVLNLLGGLSFAVYGLLIGAFPVTVVNLLTASINAFHVTRLLRARELFKLLEVKPESDYLRHFIDFNLPDIRRFLPGFSHQVSADQLTLFVLRDLVPAGLFIGRRERQGELRVQLDYVIPGYRDLKVGGFLYSAGAELLRRHGVRRLVTDPGSRDHQAYLRRMGYRPDPSRDAYVLELA
jgi:hypothetical protein